VRTAESTQLSRSGPSTHRAALIDRPAIQDNTLGAYAQSPSLNRGGSGGTGPSKLFSAEERAIFDRAQGAAD